VGAAPASTEPDAALAACAAMHRVTGVDFQPLSMTNELLSVAPTQ
jgi:hypothetical protein